MKRARFTDEQIISVLKEHEAGAKAADLARKHGTSEATLYNWKAKYGGMDVSEAKRLKTLEDENAKLKKLLAEQMLDAAAMRELLSKNGRARRAARRRRASAGRHWPVGHVWPAALSVRIGRWSDTVHAAHRTRNFVQGCGSLPTSGGAPVIGGCSSCLGEKASRRASTASTGSIAKRGSRCASAAPVAKGRGGACADPGRGEAECTHVNGFCS